MDKKVVLFTAIVGIALCVPGLAYWEYQGTWTYYDPVRSGMAADGSWWFSWLANGQVSGNKDELLITGYATGTAGVYLNPALGSNRGIWVLSTALALSTYSWVEDNGPKQIDLYVETWLDTLYIYYTGGAVGDFDGRCVASCGSVAEAMGDCYSWHDEGHLAFQVKGCGNGYACSAGGSSAYNWYDYGLTCSTDQADANDFPGWWPLYRPSGQYEGQLLAYTPAVVWDAYTFTDEELEQADTFSVMVEVFGWCQADGQIILYDPYSWGSLSANSHYYVEGGGWAVLSGDIQDRY